MKNPVFSVLFPLLWVLALAGVQPVAAGEVYGGIYAHAVDTPFTLNTNERGTDFQVGVRGAPIEALRAIGHPQPYAMVSINSEGYTDFVAAGLAWKIKVLDPSMFVPASDSRSMTHRHCGSTRLQAIAPTSAAGCCSNRK